MQRSAFIIQGILLFYLISGTGMVFCPEAVFKVKKSIFSLVNHSIRQQKKITMTPPLKRRVRAMGLFYLFACAVALSNMDLRFGRNLNSDRAISDIDTNGRVSSQQDQLVANTVLPFMRRGSCPGIVIATIADNHTSIAGFGRTTLGSCNVPDENTIFEIGSLSKVFTATLLADMIEKGEISLDEPVTSILSSENLDTEWTDENITLKHLVTHTSGLPRLPPCVSYARRLWAALTAGDPYVKCSEDKLLAPFQKERFEVKKAGKERVGQFRAGDFKYSNYGFGLLGIILSRKTGMSYNEMVQKRISIPLGLTDTVTVLSTAQQQRLATGYRSYLTIGSCYVAQIAGSWNLTEAIASAGALRSTAKDISRFLQANMGLMPSCLFSAALKRSHGTLYSNKDIRVGMGWIYTEVDGFEEPVIFHNGMTGGYAAFLGFCENAHIGVAVLANSSSKVDDIGFLILKQLMKYYKGI